MSASSIIIAVFCVVGIYMVAYSAIGIEFQNVITLFYVRLVALWEHYDKGYRAVHCLTVNLIGLMVKLGTCLLKGLHWKMKSGALKRNWGIALRRNLT